MNKEIIKFNMSGFLFVFLEENFLHVKRVCSYENFNIDEVSIKIIGEPFLFDIFSNSYSICIYTDNIEDLNDIYFFCKNAIKILSMKTRLNIKKLIVCIDNINILKNKYPELCI